jgi:hypothetical protein
MYTDTYIHVAHPFKVSHEACPSLPALLRAADRHQLAWDAGDHGCCKPRVWLQRAATAGDISRLGDVPGSNPSMIPENAVEGGKVGGVPFYFVTYTFNVYIDMYTIYLLFHCYKISFVYVIFPSGSPSGSPEEPS